VEATAAKASDWKYVSYMRDTNGMMAVMSRDGQQKMMRPGRSWNGARLVSVNEQQAVIEDAMGRHEVPRGERLAGSVEWRRMASNALPASAARNGVIEQQIRYRGIDPEHAQRAREVMRQRFSDRTDIGGGAAYPPEVLARLGLDPKQAATMSADEFAGYVDKAEAILREQHGSILREEADGVARPEVDPPDAADGEVH
jgi:hypothetical protein